MTVTARESGSQHINPLVGRAIRILLVEDSPSDRAMTAEALLESRILNELYIATDGEEAMHFLRKEGQYPDAERPDLIILDLNLPRKDGREVLAEVKGDNELKTIPVIVMTTSSAEEDVLTSYRLQASSFVTKPLGFADFMRAVHGIEDFWLSVVRLPAE